MNLTGSCLPDEGHVVDGEWGTPTTGLRRVSRLRAGASVELEVDMREYANPDALMTTSWAKNKLADPQIRLIECSADIHLYDQGHIPGAVRIDWERDLTDSQTRDLVSGNQFEKLVQTLGVSNDTTVVLYGDQSNMMACFAYWVFRSYGHGDVKILDGGRAKWVDDRLPMVTETRDYPLGRFTSQDLRRKFRARREEVLEHIGRIDRHAQSGTIPRGRALVDDRTPEEFNGILKEGDGYPQRYLRGGHIPGATNLPWVELLNHDGTFKNAEELGTVLERRKLTPDLDVVVYTRIGERAAVTWFVLHELMGFTKVRTYDGSWTEWGNLVGMPIESPTRPVRSVPPQRRAFV